MAWLINEDKALKTKLSGLKVHDVNAPAGGRPVDVWFREPESEIREITFPYITISHVNISVDSEREHRGEIYLPYAPEGWPAAVVGEKYPYKIETPIPYNVDYEITVVARKALHQMNLRAQLAGADYLHPRFAYLEVPEDNTIRRLDLLGGPEPDESKDSEGKRTFMDVYMVRVSSELLPAQVAAFYRALMVDIDLTLKTSAA